MAKCLLRLGRRHPRLVVASNPIRSFYNPHIWFQKEVDAADPSTTLSHLRRTAVHPTPQAFPWRHDSKLLTRLVPGTPDYEQQGGPYGPGVPFHEQPIPLGSILVPVAMGYPWWKALLLTSWEQELAEACSWAFGRAMSTLLSTVYKVPYEVVSQEEDEDTELVSVNFCYDPSKSTRTTDDKKKSEEDKDSSEPSKPESTLDDSTSDDNTESAEQKQQLQLMLDAKLIELFESAYESGKESLRVRLELHAPIKSELISCYWEPFVNRRSTKTGWHRYAMSNLLRQAQTTDDPYALGRKLGQELREGQNVNNGVVIAQVLIWCNEAFSVQDKTTGTMLQGNGHVQSVVHLVRMEMEVPPIWGKRRAQDEDGFVWNWKIVDIDDLLGGNLFYELD